ncbi:uncharacterized protein [Solanum tuberosum]|uniref:uncharacterized protein n=1 Tax=Solanum tuberosum TaxID=4113 RepID=UPI0003D26F57|nr:PREDICTED: uncharacterized protein LOC102605933 [Solanum tuberosum]
MYIEGSLSVTGKAVIICSGGQGIKPLAGVAFVVPIVNYQWPSLPLNLIEDDKRKKNYWWMMFLARYVPRSLLHWLVIAKSSTSSSTKNVPEFEMEKLRSRSDFDNLCNDFLVAFSKWDFDPLELISCPILENGQSNVHIWQGCEDKFINLKLQRYVAKMLPWIQYHEVHDGGHVLIYDSVVCEDILKSLLIGEVSRLN